MKVERESIYVSSWENVVKALIMDQPHENLLFTYDSYKLMFTAKFFLLIFYQNWSLEPEPTKLIST